MPVISTQSDLRSVQKLPFCYLCGNAFIEEADKTRDHVPPRAIFATSDRGCPLILPTHEKCNGAQSGYDEVVGQLIAAIHGKYPEPANVRLDVTVVEDATTGTQSAWLSGANLHRPICRCVRAFHAALYREYLPDNNGTKDGTIFSFDPPFPVGHVDANNDFTVDAISPHHTHFVEQIKRNRTAGQLDRLTCFNGKCVYECVWDRADDGQPICIFALNVYDWSALANTDDFPKRGCVGAYLPARGRPADGTTATNLVFPISNAEMLDPFGR